MNGVRMQKSIFSFFLVMLISVNIFGDESMATCPNERKHHEFNTITKSLVWTCLSEETYTEEAKKIKADEEALKIARDENARKNAENDAILLQDYKQHQRSKPQNGQQPKMRH